MEILKTAEGLIQLLRCPVCKYLVMQTDIKWKIQPIDPGDKGEVERCVYCKKGE